MASFTRALKSGKYLRRESWINPYLWVNFEEGTYVEDLTVEDYLAGDWIWVQDLRNETQVWMNCPACYNLVDVTKAAFRPALREVLSTSRGLSVQYGNQREQTRRPIQYLERAYQEQD